MTNKGEKKITLFSLDLFFGCRFVDQFLQFSTSNGAGPCDGVEPGEGFLCPSYSLRSGGEKHEKCSMFASCRVGGAGKRMQEMVAPFFPNLERGGPQHTKNRRLPGGASGQTIAR